MKSSSTSISFLIFGLLLFVSFAQDAQSAPPSNEHSIPPTVVPIDSSQSVSGNTGESAQPIVVDTHQMQSEPAQPQTASAEVKQPQTVTPSSQQLNTQSAGQAGQLNPSQDSKMKETIQKLISEMSDEEVKEFETQLAGDARKYYDELMAENQKRVVLQEKWEAEQLHQMEEQEVISPSEIQNRKQSEEFNQLWDKNTDRDISYHEYLFELGKSASEDFRFTIPVSQHVTFYGYTYENLDGVYSVPKDIQDQQPIWVYVYENNHKIVFQKQFHYKYFGFFQGNQNSSYLIRFVNPSNHKLIAFNLAVLFEMGHSADKLTAVDVADHSRRVKISREQVTNRFQDIGSREIMAIENRGELMDKLDRYYAYSIVEILIIAVLCVMQVEFVRKLLASTSVV